MYFYTIYTKELWSVLVINSSTLKYNVVHKSTILLLQDEHASNVICFSSFYYIQTYDITSCDCSHMPLHYPREKENQRKRKSNQEK